MANLKAIYMTEVEYHDGTQWKELLVEKDGTKLSAYSGHIILYSTETPSPAPASMPVTVDFNDLRMREAPKPDEDKFVAFHAEGISAAQKSPIIRYKIAVGTWTSEEIITVNQNLHYMMINAAFPADAYSGAGSTATVNQSNANVALKLYFPAFLSTHINADAVNDLKNLLQTAANWSVTKDGPTGLQTVTPSSVVVGTPTATSATAYGIAKVLVTLNCGLTFPMSGTYSLTATFQSNDVDAAYLLPGAHSVTATIMVNSGSTTPLIVSFDADATMSVSIAGA
jgi:hypothetical protein